jgi:uncharacterized protein YndB with AHSA1/START domain
MSETQHATFVIERKLSASPKRVFAAWADKEKKRAWFVEGKGFEIHKFAMDFREGGAEDSSFTFERGQMSNSTLYHDIVDNQRIVFTYSMAMGNARFSVSLATVEMTPEGEGTHLIFTEQAAFLEHADGAAMRQQGWQELLSRLETFLNGEGG